MGTLLTWERMRKECHCSAARKQWKPYLFKLPRETKIKLSGLKNQIVRDIRDEITLFDRGEINDCWFENTRVCRRNRDSAVCLHDPNWFIFHEKGVLMRLF